MKVTRKNQVGLTGRRASETKVRSPGFILNTMEGFGGF